MNDEFGLTNFMDMRLRAEIERQLLEDFHYYAHEWRDDIAIDWSDAVPEGHEIDYFDGYLEDCSGVKVVNERNDCIAWGWIDFISSGKDMPLFVFWLYLSFGHPQEDREEVVQSYWIPHNYNRSRIPQHIWDRLSESTKDLCLGSEAYDVHWCKDPLVLQWGKRKHKSNQRQKALVWAGETAMSYFPVRLPSKYHRS